jgi:chromate reductase, NAD(P)H dehydrogenase (quinone)
MADRRDGVSPRTGLMRILAISGSLRERSLNTDILRCAAMIAPPPIAVALWQGLSAIPAFNPDLNDAPPPQVTAFRAQVAAARGLMICSPEYAHGVAGQLKNALDWLVGSGELFGKPLVLINASSRATIAQAALAETLEVMGANIVLDVGIVPSGPGIAAGRFDPATEGSLKDLLGALANAGDGGDWPAHENG